MRKRKGFTLLEMVIVVSIVSILFLLTVPNIQKVLGVVNRKGCDAQTKVVDAAILQYHLENDAYPGSISDLIQAGLIDEEQAYCGDHQSITIEDGHAVHS